MRFSWTYSGERPRKIKDFLREQGMSRSLFAKIKFQGGLVLVNGHVQNALYLLTQGDVLEVEIPAEGEHETMLLDPTPIEIVFEDEHYIIVNKPSGVASIPAQYHPNGTMANRVKNYYCQQNYADRVIHVVTRLDRDTTGLMLFAKHGYAHAMIDQELQNHRVLKKYTALVGGDFERLKDHDLIDLPIERDLTSIIKRQTGPGGLAALTEYWLTFQGRDASLVDIQLHTGRTHQIRVHFAALNCPLLGDEMYGGNLTLGIERQALHCCELGFVHPFTKEKMAFQLDLPADMAQVKAKQVVGIDGEALV